MAIGIGATLAGAPLLTFDLWLGGIVERQGRADVATSAKRAITLAETRLNQVVEALDSLAERGVASCTGANIAAMRNAVFATTPVKWIDIAAPSGETLCTHGGQAPMPTKLLSSEALPGEPNYRFEIVAAGNDQRMVRLRRPSGEIFLDALVPTELLLPQVSTSGGPLAAHASIVTAAGTLVGESGMRPVAIPAEGEGFGASLKSAKFGFTIEMMLPRGRMPSTHGDLQALRNFIAALFIFLIFGFAAMRPRASPNNPVAELERALSEGQFVPYYQPIVDIRSGQLRGAEILVRWRKPDGTLVLPGAFIPLAESSGLIEEMTRDLMRRVCVEAGPALSRRPGLKVAFNFAAQLFRNESIVKDVRKIFTGSLIDMSQVVIELTERDPIDDLTETRRVIAALQGLGVRIAIDDVGTGHSGLSYMLKLGVDIIKIDKMFVDAIGTDRNSTTIVETLIDLAHNMRMDVVAEGVESFEQVVHLRELGIRSAQGYVFAPPLPGSAFLQLIEAADPMPAESLEGKVAGAARRYISARNRFETA
jgi:sensor c-di-GMP phosphodiesterase-like protein